MISGDVVIDRRFRVIVANYHTFGPSASSIYGKTREILQAFRAIAGCKIAVHPGSLYLE